MLHNGTPPETCVVGEAYDWQGDYHCDACEYFGDSFVNGSYEPLGGFSLERSEFLNGLEQLYQSY
jgi:hypothetical protein